MYRLHIIITIIIGKTMPLVLFILFICTHQLIMCEMFSNIDLSNMLLHSVSMNKKTYAT